MATNANDILVGTPGHDAIGGLGGDDWVRGLAGDDTLAGDAGDDLLAGGDGRDVLNGGSGNDLLSGDAGDDLLDGGSGSQDGASYSSASGPVVASLAARSVTGAAGNDTLSGIENLAGSAWADELEGDEGPNLLSGDDGADTIRGQSGRDGLGGGRGADLLEGGAGDDTLIGGAGNDTLDGGAHDHGDWAFYAVVGGPVAVDLAAGLAQDGWGGIDKLLGIENVQAGRFDDALRGDSASNVFIPGAGNDSVDGGAGADWISYEDASGPVSINLQAGSVSGSAGRDTLVSIEGAQGSEFGDLLLGTRNGDTLAGGGGEDTLAGGAGNDSLDGGTNNMLLGADWVSYVAAEGPVNVNLATGLATGAEGSDTLTGIEAVMGGSFPDTLIGDGEDNVLRGNGGNDQIDGGAGAGDWSDYSNASGPVIVNLVSGTATGADGQDSLSHIERIAGSQFADVLSGDALDNRLRGNGGNDTLDGAAGRDGVDYNDAPGPVTVRLALGTATGADGFDALIGIENVHGSFAYGDDLRGDNGPNLIEGRGGNDVIDGGSGVDIAFFNGAFSQYRVLIEVGNFDLIVAGPEGVDRLNNVEILQFADRLFVVRQGGEAADHLQAVEAGELLRGRGGNDDISGGTGQDALYGDDGSDTLAGGANSDFLDGGTGSDAMAGGAGSDVYVVDSAGDVVVELAEFASLAEDDSGRLSQSIGESIDTVIASIAYTLGDFLENLTLAPGAGTLEGTGNSLDNVLEGNESANLLEGGAGNDTLTGAGGIDTAVYAGMREDYVLVALDTGFWVQGPDTDGTDTVDVERLQFADSNLALDLEANAGMVAKILGAVFGPASVANAGYAGIGLDLADAGTSYESLMSLALDARLGADPGKSHPDVVTLLYTNVAGVPPDALALAYYQSLLDSGEFTPTSLGVFAAETTYNQDNIDLTGLAATGLGYL